MTFSPFIFVFKVQWCSAGSGQFMNSSERRIHWQKLYAKFAHFDENILILRKFGEKSFSRDFLMIFVSIGNQNGNHSNGVSCLYFTLSLMFVISPQSLHCFRPKQNNVAITRRKITRRGNNICFVNLENMCFK